jgi:hypothetical protein
MAQELCIELASALAERAGTRSLGAFLDEPRRAHAGNLLFLHGAGLDRRGAFMEAFATAWCDRGWRVLRFDQPYMQRVHDEGRRRPPDRMPVLLAASRAALAFAQEQFGGTWSLAGKSMGARIATLIAAEEPDVFANTTRGGIRAVLALGYPLHPPTKPQELRVAHFPRIGVPLFVAQGTRDPFGSAAELAPHLANIATHNELFTVDGGDHDFDVLARLRRSQADVVSDVAERSAQFLLHHTRP